MKKIIVCILTATILIGCGYNNGALTVKTKMQRGNAAETATQRLTRLINEDYVPYNILTFLEENSEMNVGFEIGKDAKGKIITPLVKVCERISLNDDLHLFISDDRLAEETLITVVRQLLDMPGNDAFINQSINILLATLNEEISLYDEELDDEVNDNLKTLFNENRQEVINLIEIIAETQKNVTFNKARDVERIQIINRITNADIRRQVSTIFGLRGTN